MYGALSQHRYLSREPTQDRLSQINRPTFEQTRSQDRPGSVLGGTRPLPYYDRVERASDTGHKALWPVSPPAIQTPATLPAVTAPPTEPQPPALCARRARAVTPVPPWPSPRAAQPRHPSAKSSICEFLFYMVPHAHIGERRCYVGGVRGATGFSYLLALSS